VALSSGRQALLESLAVGRLAPPPGGRNVILIVCDTVRAYNRGLYGYPRNTTPNLSRWARQSVRYRFALAATPWIYVSLCDPPVACLDVVSVGRDQSAEEVGVSYHPQVEESRDQADPGTQQEGRRRSDTDRPRSFFGLARKE
jgi:Sulfatase